MSLDKLKTGIKKFFSNPNTVTFMLVIVLIVVVYVVYSIMVKKATSPISIPYATKDLTEKTQITRDMVGTVKVSGNYITSNNQLIKSQNYIIGKFVANNYKIPGNSFFYQEQLTSDNLAEETDASNIPDGHTIYRLKVNFHSTYGCSIMNGDYIDLFFKGTDTNNKLIYALFIKSIKVLKVADDNGLDVFKNTEDGQQLTPAYIEFDVPDDYYELLRVASLKGYEIIPVPRNSGYSENPEETSIANTTIQNMILSNQAYR